jgi:phospholipase/carboxylesterase
VTGNPHLETEPLVLGPEAGPTAVLVHGRGSGPESMLDLAGRLAAAGVRCVLPAAAGATWYPQRFTAPLDPRRYRAVAGLRGGLMGADGELTRPQGLDGTPVLLTSAEDDAWVPAERTRESAELLAAGGARVDLRVFGPGSHAIRAEEADAVAALVP